LKIISTATTLTNAFKNVGRLNEIIRVFFIHGFADLIQRAHLGKFLPKRVSQSEKFQSLPIEVRLRMSFEQLGPTFIKFGQLLASRPDLIPIHYVEEFQKLQDQVQPSHTPELKEYLEAELKKPLSQIFSSFDEIPMAAASIGQVHAATLVNGEEVIVKIQRPGVEKILHQDISILRGIAALLEKYIPEVKIFNPTGIVEEFFKTLLFETDYKVEANNIRKIKANFEAKR
jgi:ubiquinone biosynthesis protein